MTVKIYVGNVPPKALNSELKELFEKFGKVVECDILKEFAFVHMEDVSDAKAAIAGLNDTLWKGNRIRVEISTTKGGRGEPAPFRERERRYDRRRSPDAYDDRRRGSRSGPTNDRDRSHKERHRIDDYDRGEDSFRGGRGGREGRSRDDRFHGKYDNDGGSGRGGPMRTPRFSGRGGFSDRGRSDRGRPYPGYRSGAEFHRDGPPPRGPPGQMIPTFPGPPDPNFGYGMLPPHHQPPPISLPPSQAPPPQFHRGPPQQFPPGPFPGPMNNFGEPFVHPSMQPPPMHDFYRGPPMPPGPAQPPPIQPRYYR